LHESDLVVALWYSFCT